MTDQPIMPSQVDSHVGLFDRFAGWAAAQVSRAWFFALCVLLVIIWGPSFPLFGTVDTWQLVINTATTIVTFLLVALLQNSQARADAAVQQKLNALADGLADLMGHISDEASDDEGAARLLRDADELRAAIGLERRSSTS